MQEYFIQSFSEKLSKLVSFELFVALFTLFNKPNLKFRLQLIQKTNLQNKKSSSFLSSRESLIKEFIRKRRETRKI